VPRSPLTAVELVNFIDQILFVGLFAVVLRHALRHRSRAGFNTALLFGSIAAVVVGGRVAHAVGFADHPAYPGLVLTLLAVAPFAMLRLVADFSDSSRLIQVVGWIGFLAVAVLALTVFGPMERQVALLAIVFFLVVGGYAAWAFGREALRTRGITRRRMTAVTVGAVAFIATLVLIFGGVILPAWAEVTAILVQVAALVSVVAFFLGFAPPGWIRRAWREPDLRRFLERSIHLAGIADERQAVAELNQAAASAFGAHGASIGLADPERGVLRYVARATGDWVEHPDDRFVAGRAYREGRRLVAADAPAADPEHAEAYRASGARAVIAAPIATGARRLGVLVVFAERMSIFAEDDLWLIDLLADQIAVLLEARALAEHATELRAREEAARLKEEFLSAAAHDLRTPLTVVLGQAELLERRQQRNPDAPADAQGLARIAREARRLSDLVTELLDAQRLELGRAVLDRAPTDLLDVVRAVRERYADGDISVTTEAAASSLNASIDRPRIEQVLDNLVENALKYTTNGEPPEIRLAAGGGMVSIAVVDHGIGIPRADRHRIFERFFRASNAESITDTGLGLGLYICRRIVEEHGGHIRFDPTPGGGTTFTIALPLLAATDETGTHSDRGRWESRAPRGAAIDV
jgi:signal transduction histidine kinase